VQAVVQRVTHSSVTAEGQEISKIGAGLMVLLGVARGDNEAAADWLADKIIHLRIFEDLHGRMNQSLMEVNGDMLVVSQFTLLGDCRKGRRPSFAQAAPPELAESLYNRFVQRVAQRGIRVATGKFRSAMKVALINDGPVTLIVSSSQ